MNFSREKRKIESLTKKGVKTFAADEYETAWRLFDQVLSRDEDIPSRTY